MKFELHFIPQYDRAQNARKNLRKSCAQRLSGCAISTRQYGSLTNNGNTGPRIQPCSILLCITQNICAPVPSVLLRTTACGVNRLGFPVLRVRHVLMKGRRKDRAISTTHGYGFNIENAATMFLTKQNRIYNSNLQHAGPDIDLSARVRCLSDLGWISEACVNSRYTGADCNISSRPGRLASINRPIHQPAVLPLTRVSEASEGNKWWREGINQTEGGQTPGPWLVQSSPEIEHDGGAGLRCTKGTALLFLEMLG